MKFVFENIGSGFGKWFVGMSERQVLKSSGGSLIKQQGLPTTGMEEGISSLYDWNRNRETHLDDNDSQLDLNALKNMIIHLDEKDLVAINKLTAERIKLVRAEKKAQSMAAFEVGDAVFSR